MTCHELRALLPMLLLGQADADADRHLAGCLDCRAALEALRSPKASFTRLAQRLQDEPRDCDDELVTLIAYGEAASSPHLADCARCRDRLDQLRALIVRLDRLSTLPIRSFAPPPLVDGCDPEAVTLSLYGEATLHDCARCRDAADRLRPTLARLDTLRDLSRATFRPPRRRAIFWQLATAAAVLLLLLSPLLRRAPALPLPREPLAIAPSDLRLDDLPALEALALGSDSRAAAAISRLRDLGGPAGEAALLAVLRKRPPLVDAVAAALGALHSRAAVEELAALASPAAIAALADINDPAAIPAFLGALENPASADDAMRGLARLPESSVVQWLELFKNGATPAEGAALVSAPHSFIRDTARWIAWRSSEHRAAIIDWAARNDAGLPFLVEVSLDLTLGSDAIDALSKMPRDRVTRAVAAALRDPGRAQAAGHAAVELRLPVAHDLERAARRHPDLWRNLAILDPLRVLDAAIAGSDEAASSLAVVDPDDLRRIASARRSVPAAAVLARLRHPALLDYFISMLPRAPATCARALGDIRDARAVPHLIPYLDNPRVALDVRDALRSITGADGASRAEWERWWSRNRKST